MPPPAASTQLLLGTTGGGSGGVTTVDWLLLAVVVVLVGLSALLALAETSLVRTSKARALGLEDEGRRGARQLVELVEHPERFLSGVLLMVLVCQLVAASLIGVLAEHFFGAVGVALAAVVEVVVIFVLAEAIPKNWAVRNPDRSALFAAPFVRVLVGFAPLRWLSAGLLGIADLIIGSHQGSSAGAGVTESELLALADVAMEEKVIATEERALIHSIIEFGDTVVRAVMVPRPDMRTLDADLSVAEGIEVAMEAGFSRLPVHDGNVDDVIGIAYLKDLFRAERADGGSQPLRDHIRPARFVPETKRVAHLMQEMQEQKFHQAIVVDEYGGTAGLVTLEDLIEELVGEIVDEFDVEEPPVVTLPSGGVSVSARLAVGELSEVLGVDLPAGGWDTVGGLVFDVLGHVPVEGESLEAGGLRFVAERVQGSRIGRVLVTRAGRESPGQDQGSPAATPEAELQDLERET